MNCKTLFALTVCFCIVGCADVAPSNSARSKNAVAGAAPTGEMKLPPGWTQADMQACMVAGQPGKQHEHLAKDIGTWHGKNTMWMAPGSEPMTSESTTVVTSMMGGRFTKGEVKGEMPGMGPFEGLGVYGFDNVSQKFVSTWTDSQSTGIMYGTGELSPDGKAITWKYTYNCPLNNKPAVMREIDRWTGANSKTLEMWGSDPKSGKEFKMMQIELTRK